MLIGSAGRRHRAGVRDLPECLVDSVHEEMRRWPVIPVNRLRQAVATRHALRYGRRHEGSHEKGGVEGKGGQFRRTRCVPMPVVDSIEELNAVLDAWDDADDARRIGNRTSRVGTDRAVERALLRPLPDEPFDTALTLTPGSTATPR
jgi:hypothetical protein